MRILIIHRSFALVGGAERVIISKANYLSERNHQVMLVSYEQGLHPISYKLNPEVQVKDLDCRFFTLSKYSPLAHLSRFLQLIRKFRRTLHDTVGLFRPDVIILASDWQFLVRHVLYAAKAIPVMCEFHNSYDFIVKNIGNGDSGIKSKLTRAYYQYKIRGVKNCFKLISLTENDAKHWRKYSNNVSVIANPLFSFPDRIDDVPKLDGRIICVGRLNDQKRIDRLIDAFSMIANQHHEWYIEIFGEGAEKDALEKQIKSLGLEKRVILNPPTKAIFDEYKKAQMLVLSSEYEGRPLVLIESMSCGTPCVSFDCPSGPAEIIDDRVTGLLVKNGDVNDLAEKMNWLIEHDKERSEMGKKSRIAAEKYRPSHILREWEKAYTSINGQNGQP